MKRFTKPNPQSSSRRCALEALEGRLLMYALHDENWDFDHNRITYSYSNLFDGVMAGMGVSNNDMRAAVEEALALWSSVAPIQFVERPDFHLPRGLFQPVNDDDYRPDGFAILRFGHHPQ